MDNIEVEGKTVEEAIRTGLDKLGCSRENVEIKILDEGTSGLFGLMGNKPARVLVSVTPGAQAVDYSFAQSRVKEILADILALMKITFKEVNTALLTGRILADIKSDESSFIIGKNGQTLEAIEHVVNLILNRNKTTRIKVYLDCENYVQKQGDKFDAIAKKAAEQVKSTRKIYRFDPMPSRDRRLIHLSLKNDPDVETFSEGEGMFRKVAIKPKDNK